MFPQISSSQMAGSGGLFISPTEKVAIGDETQLSATDQMRPVVLTIEASTLIRLGTESGYY